MTWLALCLSASAADTFQAGAATSNITPPLGTDIIGGFVPFPSKHIHDELHARCLVLDDGQDKLAFGSVDVPEHVFNRRWRMEPGTIPANPFGGTDLVKMNPPSGSPNLIEPAGPIDPAVSIIAVRGTDDRLISVFSAYSLHYVGG